MYSCLGSIQVIVALLKKYGIRDIIFSPGTRNVPLVHSVEQDEFFRCYSIVDERSASFFALGIIEEKQKPVAVCCTSGTAVANYVSATCEAFYQHLPLVLLTADRNPYYKFQQEEQMIPQTNLYAEVCKKHVTLPIVRDQKDLWYCARLVNEALLEMEHREKGPVQINFPVENNYPVYQGIVKFDAKQLPDVHKIERLSVFDDDAKWKSWAEKLKYGKILILYGQHGPLNEKEQFGILAFSRKYDCIFSKDLLSNLHVGSCLDTSVLAKVISDDILTRLSPNIVITMNANSISELKMRLSAHKDSFTHWHVSSDGEVSDPFRCLPDFVECDPLRFFEKMASFAGDDRTKFPFYSEWKSEWDKIHFDGGPINKHVEYSAVYAVQALMKNLPDVSLLHCANSNSVRIASHFPPGKNVAVYCNRGCSGIDGSMSSFVGQAHSSGKPSFLIIGDLSFLYDMNALWNRYIGKNIRILVCNNSGGAIFHNYPGKRNIPNLDEYIAAEHHTSVKDWAVSREFKYIGVHDKMELDVAMKEFVSFDSDVPVLLEAFTDKENDVYQMNHLLDAYRPVSLKSVVGKHLSPQQKAVIKRLIGHTK